MPLLLSTRTDVSTSRNYSLASLALVGLILGLIHPAHPTALGGATMAGVLLLALVEAALGLTRHSLLGLEIIMCCARQLMIGLVR
jgi:hypothetical protein